MMAAAIDKVACTKSAGMISAECDDGDAPARIADGARRLDIFLHFDRHHLPARQPHEYRRGGHADGDHGVGKARTEKGGQRDGQDQEGAGEHRIGEAARSARRQSRRR